MKEEMIAYKKEMDEKREADRILFSELLKDEKMIFFLLR